MLIPILKQMNEHVYFLGLTFLIITYSHLQLTCSRFTECSKYADGSFVFFNGRYRNFNGRSDYFIR